jgi:glycosyltransferase involved in cell wall biosynthesis
MVTTFYPPYNFGGDGMHVYRLSNELAGRGHHVDVFHCEDAYLMLNGGRPAGEFPNHENVKVHGLKSRFGPLSPIATQQTGSALFKRHLKSELKAGRYDVIHYHNISLMGITALSFGTAVKLYTTHEHWLVCPMHVLWKFNREVCSSKSCIRCQLAGKRPPQLWRMTGLMDKMLKHVDCFLSPSEFTRRKHLEMGLDIPIISLPNFLPLADVQIKAKSGNQPHRPYFLFVGRLEYIKGVQNLIPVFRKRPEIDLFIAGDGNFRHELTELAAGAENIVFLGRQDSKRLIELYQAATAVIVPSICYETFDQTVIEAFAQKTPVIVNALGALPELVAKSHAGFAYETQGQLAEAVDTLAGDRELRDELGEKGYRAFLAHWSEDAYLTEYLSLIERLRREKRSASSAESVELSGS